MTKQADCGTMYTTERKWGLVDRDGHLYTARGAINPYLVHTRSAARLARDYLRNERGIRLRVVRLTVTSTFKIDESQ